MKFPRLMFRTPGPEQCQGGRYAHHSVTSQDEYDAALANGWHGTLPEALAPATIISAPPAVPTPEPVPVNETGHLLASQSNAEHLETSIEQANQGRAQPRDLVEDQVPALTVHELTAPPTYDEMKIKAKQLGLEFQGNISKAALLAMITAKLAEQV